MGLLAAMGVLLCLRIAGDVSRPRRMRIAAAAATPTLATGGYLTLSRGAILAFIVGLVALALLQPVRAQLRAMTVAATCAAPAVAVSAVLDGVRALEGSPAARRQEGLVMLAVLLLASAAAGLAVAREARTSSDRRVSNGMRRGLAVAGAITAFGVVVTFGVLLGQHQETTFSPLEGPDNARLASAESVRGDFWRVARGAFADEPFHGVGSGGYAAAWLRERPILNAARDAHSLYLETAAELGVVGLALLLAFLGGVAACARTAWRLDPSSAAGPVAVLAAWAVHAGLDWDWEMPGLTLVAILLAALLVARSQRMDPPRNPPRAPLHEPVAARLPAEVGR
jgi:O-antigen ligase